MEKQLQSLCLEASNKILEYYKNDDLQIEQKGDDSPVTIADKEANKIIESGLKDILDCPILSEEGQQMPFESRSQWTKFWMVDPLDGTKGFIKQTDDFTVNIALLENNQPVLGAVMNPVTKDFYFAEKSKGASKNGNSISTSDKTQPPFTATGSVFHGKPEEKQWYEDNNIVDVEFINSSIKLCMVAEGRFDIYRRFGPTMEWDIAAAQVVLEEAGGKLLVTPNLGSMPYNKSELRNSPFIVVSNPQVLSRLNI